MFQDTVFYAPLVRHSDLYGALADDCLINNDVMVAALLAMLFMMLWGVAYGKTTLRDQFTVLTAMKGSRKLQTALRMQKMGNATLLYLLSLLSLSLGLAVLTVCFLHSRGYVVRLEDKSMIVALSTTTAFWLSYNLLVRVIDKWIIATFFSHLKSEQWNCVHRFYMTMFSVLILIADMVILSNGIDGTILAVLCAAVLVLPQILLIFSACRMIFDEKFVFLHFLLYLCTLNFVFPVAGVFTACLVAVQSVIF